MRGSDLVLGVASFVLPRETGPAGTPPEKQTSFSTVVWTAAPIMAPSRECGSSMCQKCIELDKRIGRLKRIAAQLLDPATVEAAAQLVAEMEAQKKALHPEQS